MESIRMLEIGTIALYLGACVAVGLLYAKKARESEENFWVAGRFMGTFTGAFAIFADVATASSVIGIVGLTYKFGVPFAAMVAAAFTLQFPLALYLVAKPLRDRKLFTLGDFFKDRFGKGPHGIYSILTFIFMSAYVIPQIKACALLASWLVDIPYETAVLIAGFTSIGYIMLGTMYAISITNIAEGLFDGLGTFVIAVAAIFYFMPSGGLIATGIQSKPAIAQLGMPLSSTMGIALTWALWGCVAPMTVMRFMSTQSSKSLRRSLGTGTAMAAIIVGFTAIVLGLAASILDPGLKNADMALMRVIDEFLPRAGKAVFAAVLFGTTMTTTDCLIFAATAAATNDIYKGFINPKASEKHIMRLGTILAGIIGATVTIVALYPLPLISIMTAMTAGGLISCFLFPVLLGIYWKKANGRGALLGMIGGFISFVVLDRSGLLPAVTAMLIAVPISALLTYAGSLGAKAAEPEVQRA
jgi:sodium/proline symporter